MPLPYLTRLIQKLAPKVGARVVVEPEWGIVAQIIYKNGVVRSLRNYSVDLNPIASADIAKDKGYAKFFMKKKSYPVAEGGTFFSKEWGEAIKRQRGIPEALKYAKKLGYPVIVKPNSQSQGVKVSLVCNRGELEKALKEIFKIDRIAIVERYLPGRDYRIVVLDNEIISAYERVPLSVVGDGKSTILKLLQNKQEEFVRKGRDTKINFSDLRIKNKLKKQNLKYSSILQKTKTIFLLDNANLSTGGDSVDVTRAMHPGFRKIAIDLTKDMGLRIAGVDIMVRRGDIAQNPKNSNFYVIEINAAPGLDHYVTTGPVQKKIVEDMYLKILRALGKKD